VMQEAFPIHDITSVATPRAGVVCMHNNGSWSGPVGFPSN
jgi:hypothetical protein